MTVVMTAGISKKIASYTIPLAVYFVTVRELQGLQRFKSDSKVLFDTFSFKKKYYLLTFKRSSPGLTAPEATASTEAKSSELATATMMVAG